MWKHPVCKHTAIVSADWALMVVLCTYFTQCFATRSNLLNCCSARFARGWGELLQNGFIISFVGLEPTDCALRLTSSVKYQQNDENCCRTCLPAQRGCFRAQRAHRLPQVSQPFASVLVHSDLQLQRNGSLRMLGAFVTRLNWLTPLPSTYPPPSAPSP
jgi:hypothetical protein